MNILKKSFLITSMALITASPCFCTNDNDSSDDEEKSFFEKIAEKIKDKVAPNDKLNEIIEKLEHLVNKASEFPQGARDLKDAADTLEKIGPKTIWHAAGAGIVFVSAATVIICTVPKLIGNLFGS